LYARSLVIHSRFGEKEGVAGNLRGLAVIAGLSERPQQAAHLFGAAEALRESIGVAVPLLGMPRYERAVASTQAKLTREQFETAWAAGRTLSFERAVAEGEALAANLASPPTSNPANFQGLSPREFDVLQLVAQELSTAEIAERLFISPRTVTTHLSSIYNKLGVNSRTAATRYAVERGLV
jgi:DNA-binding CsgD family transcriptional regulator